MTCAEAEILICDYLDGAAQSEERAGLERHMEGCAACASIARDARAAMAFMEQAAPVELPPELVTRILMETASGRHGRLAVRSGFRGWLSGLLSPVLRPRLVMGMALAIFSFSMMGRMAGLEVRQLRPSDLNPVKVWSALDDRAHRLWERTVKHYESIRFVYEMQARLREWTAREEEAEQSQPPAADEHKLPSAPATQ
ncbi:MAG: anti-sigma factor [Bryobacteraceae bacterium]